MSLGRLHYEPARGCPRESFETTVGGMNKKGLRKLEGKHVRVSPPPFIAPDKCLEPNQWLVHKVVPARDIELRHAASPLVLKLGLDSLKEFREPDWLRFNSLIFVRGNGDVYTEPIDFRVEERIFQLILSNALSRDWLPRDLLGAALKQMQVAWHSEDGENIWPRDPPDVAGS